MDTTDNIKKLSDMLGAFIFMQLSKELVRQGHKLTGSLAKSFETKVKKEGEKVSIQFLMLIYGRSLNDGIKPAKIPFTPVPPYRGGTSKYIEGLIKFATLKFGADKKRAKNIAFAIATKQKKQGYPLTKKIGFIDNVLAADSKKIESIISDYYTETIQEIIKQFIKEKLKK
tara:strand:- start:867 stop:1379 length:513 start_codon:yes stop_codon:yes gene_type:complete